MARWVQMRRAAAARVAVRTRSSSSTPLFRLWLSSFSPAAFFEPPHPTARDADEGFGVSADRIRRGARDATRRARGTGRELSHDESGPVLRSRRQARSRRRARGRLGHSLGHRELVHRVRLLASSGNGRFKWIWLMLPSPSS